MAASVGATKLAHRKAILLAYLNECVRAQDWHAVRDAAADLEVVQARLDERMETEREALTRA